MIRDKRKRRVEAAQRRNEDDQLVQVARWLSLLADAIAQGQVNADVVRLNGLYIDDDGQQMQGDDQVVLLYLKPDDYAGQIPADVKAILKKWMGHDE
jgi:hypothetical protein